MLQYDANFLEWRSRTMIWSSNTSPPHKRLEPMREVVKPKYIEPSPHLRSSIYDRFKVNICNQSPETTPASLYPATEMSRFLHRYTSIFSTPIDFKYMTYYRYEYRISI